MNIFINERQEHLLRESIKMTKDDCPLSILDGPILSRLVSERGEDTASYFSDDIQAIKLGKVSDKLNKLLNVCRKKEKNIRSQLESICYNTLIELFNIPDGYVQFSCKLVDEIGTGKEFHMSPGTNEDREFEDVEEIDNMKNEVEKRKLMNALFIGGSITLSEECRKDYINDIFELDEELPHLYSKIMKLNDYLMSVLTFKNDDHHHNQLGWVEVKLGDDEHQTMINVEATNFPVLLSESIRGFMELFVSHGLPDSLSDTKEILDKADTLEDEPFYMKVGPVIWKHLTKCIEGFEPKMAPEFLKNISEMDAFECVNFLEEIIYGTKKGKALANGIYRESVHNSKYNDFYDDLCKKQDDRTLIADDGMVNEELDEMAYPVSFNLQEFSNISSFRGRIDYCERRLQRIASGSSRIVYKIDNEKVLKLAKNKKGLVQNEAEVSDWYMHKIGCFADVFEADENYQWIEMELARKARVSDFKRLTGYDFRFLCAFIDDIHNAYSRYHTYIPEEYRMALENLYDSEYYDDSLFNELNEYLGNYQLNAIGDLKRISSWGVVNRNGEERLVIIDYGLTDDIFNEYYRE